MSRSLVIHVSLNDDALADELSRYQELKRILKKVAYEVDDDLTTGRHGGEGRLRDVNGNTVGLWHLTGWGETGRGGAG